MITLDFEEARERRICSYVRIKRKNKGNSSDSDAVE